MYVVISSFFKKIRILLLLREWRECIFLWAKNILFIKNLQLKQGKREEREEKFRNNFTDKKKKQKTKQKTKK